MADTKPAYIDATEEIHRYRLMLREVWSSYVYSDLAVRDRDMVDRFRKCETFL